MTAILIEFNRNSGLWWKLWLWLEIEYDLDIYIKHSGFNRYILDNFSDF